MLPYFLKFTENKKMWLISIFGVHYNNYLVHYLFLWLTPPYQQEIEAYMRRLSFFIDLC